MVFCCCGTQTWYLHPSFPQSHLTQFKPSNQSRTAYPDDILPPPTPNPTPNPSHSDCKLCCWLREQWLTAVEQGRDCFRLCVKWLTPFRERERERQDSLRSLFELNAKSLNGLKNNNVFICVMWCVFSSVVCFKVALCWNDEMLDCVLLSQALELCFVGQSEQREIKSLPFYCVFTVSLLRASMNNFSVFYWYHLTTHQRCGVWTWNMHLIDLASHTSNTVGHVMGS